MNTIKQKEGESKDDYLTRLFTEGDRYCENIEKNFADMKSDGIVRFCKKCGGNIYNDKEHIC